MVNLHTSHRPGDCPVAEQLCAHEELRALSALDMDGIGVKKNLVMKLPYVTGRPYPLDAARVLEELNNINCFVFLETSRVAGEENTS